MYTSTNIRFPMYCTENNLCYAYPDFNSPFSVTGILEVGYGNDYQLSYSIMVTEESFTLTTHNEETNQRDTYRLDRDESVQHIDEIYMVACEGFEHAIESFIFAVLNGDN